MTLVASYMTPQLHLYSLEPGDGTRYQFGFFRYDHDAIGRVNTFSYERKGDSKIPVEVDVKIHDNLGVITTGIGPTGKQYVRVFICMSHSQGAHDLMLESVRNPDDGLLGYCLGHMANVDKYTMAAVLFALSKLVDQPYAISKAQQEMLRAPELL